jgi:hypothetical protein
LSGRCDCWQLKACSTRAGGAIKKYSLASYVLWQYKSGGTTHQQAVHDGQADVACHHHAALVLVEQVTAQHNRQYKAVHYQYKQ